MTESFEQKYQFLINNISDVIVEIDVNGYIVYMSPQVQTLFGFNSEELIGTKCFDFIHPNDLLEFGKVMKNVITSGKPISFEFRAKHKDEHYIDVSVRGNIVNQNGKIRIIGVLRDITERKSSEEILQLSEEKYRSLFQESPFGIAIMDSNGIFIDCNDKALELFQYKYDEIIGSHFNNIAKYPKESFPLVINNFKTLIKGKIPEPLELKLFRKDGSIINVRLNSSLINVGGRSLFQFIAQDVTKYNEALTRVKDSEEQFRTIFASIPDLFFLFSKDGTILDYRGKKSDLYLSPERFLGKKVTEVLPPDLGNQSLNAIKTTIESKSPTIIEYSLPIEGELRYFEARHLYFAENQIAAFIRDISERKSAEEKLSKSIALLVDVQRVARLGYWGWNIVENKIIWSDEIYEFNKRSEDYKPSLKDWLKSIHPDDRNKVMKAIKEIRNGRNHFSNELRILDASGEIYYVHSEWEIKRDENNKPIRIIGTVLDVTEQKLAELKIKKSEAQYRNTINSLADALHVVDRDLRIILVNSAFNQWLNNLNLNKDIIGKRLFEAFPFHSEALKQEYEKVFNTGEILITEETTVLENREIITETRKIPIFVDGQVVQIITIIKDITESTKTKNMLKESEKNYRLITENSNDLICVVDNHLKMEFINEKAHLNILGYNKEDLIGKRAQILRHPEESEQVKEFIKDVTKNGESSQEGRLRHKNGDWKWFDIRARLYLDQNQQWKGLLISRDISERKESEQKLKESEEKYRLITENANDLIAILNNNNFKHEFINEQTYQKILGYSNEDMLGKRKWDIIHPDDLQNSLEALRIGFITGIGLLEARLRHKDGHYIWFEIKGQRYTDQRGENKGLLICREITKRKLTEQKLKESEERYRNLYENIAGCTVIIGNDYLIKDVNERTCEITGYTKDELIGQKCDIICPKGSASKACPIWEEGKDGFKGMDTTIKCKDKRKNPILKNAKKITLDEQTYILENFQDISDRKLVEQKLEESEEKYRLITEQANDLIDVLNEKYYIEYINEDVHKRVLGYSQEDMIGKFVGDFLHSDETIRILEVIKEGFIKGTGIAECRIKKKDGTYIWYESKGRIFKDKNGNNRALIISRDITERKMAEKQLKESEERFKIIFEYAPDAYYLHDMAGHFVDGNKAAEELVGYKKEELAGKDLAMVLPEDQIPIAKKFLLKSQKGKRLGPNEFIILNKNGKEIPVEILTHPIQINNQNFVLGIARDITERKRAEQRLKESEEKFRIIYNNANDAIVIINTHGKFVEVNKKTCELLGYTYEHLLELGPKDISIPKEMELVEKRIKETLANGKNLFETILVDIKNNPIPCEISTNEIILNNKSAIIAIGRDITERKIAEEKLKESEEKFRHLFENSPFSIVLFDQRGNILDCNSATQNFFGMDRKKMISKNYLKLASLNPENEPILKERLMHLIKGENIEEKDFKILKNDGTAIWINSRLSTINIGNQMFFYSIMQDITEKKILENLMFELNQNFFHFTTDFEKNIELLIQTVDNLSNGIVVLYARKFYYKDNEILQIISSKKETFELKLHEFKNRFFIDEIFEQKHEIPHIFSDLDQTNYIITDPFIQKYNLKGGYGKIIKKQDDFESLICILYQSNPDVNYEEQLILLLVSDAIAIEEQRWQLMQKLEEQNEKLNQIDKIKSEFLRRISHELKTPLISIKGYSDLIINQNKEFFDIDTILMIDEIKNGCSRLETLISELLKSSQLETGQIELKKSWEDLTFLIKFT
ncbi:MAG: PAS domain S-box protein, partial [Candidatus Hermodarchaeota archaeon]